MVSEEKAGAYQKARQINLDAARHGTFAEIGAGQEVARWFFRVGGAAATVAKTISAYDMTVSDAIYGPCDRYVSRNRLQAMLEHEYSLLLERLDAKRGATTTFFVFAETAAMGSSTHNQPGHAWIGMRFQHQPKVQPSEIILHVRMFETDNVYKQEALGILGVNLIYGGLYHYQGPANLISSLRDDLARERFEVDMIRFSGPCFAGVDNRLMSLQLVEQGFTDAAMFDAQGEVVQPHEVLFEKPILVERGSFRPVTRPGLDLLERAAARFAAELSERPVVVMEMSLRNLLSGDRIDHGDFLARVDILGALGKTVIISNFPYYYRLSAYLRFYTSKRIVFALGIPNLQRLFDEKYYTELPGGILESFGRLFMSGVKLYVYPTRNCQTGTLVTAETLAVAPNLRHLYAHLIDNKLIESIRDISEKDLHILPKEVLAMIQTGDPAWESMVPQPAIKLIKERGVFGYRPPAEAAVDKRS
ncbi:MAG: TonB-dependent receptor [Acidobacteriia bacterium]|nr:TonB-dependent receptor [Terriglobia bacterium]